VRAVKRRWAEIGLRDGLDLWVCASELIPVSIVITVWGFFFNLWSTLSRTEMNCVITKYSTMLNMQHITH